MRFGDTRASQHTYLYEYTWICILLSVDGRHTGWIEHVSEDGADEGIAGTAFSDAVIQSNLAGIALRTELHCTYFRPLVFLQANFTGLRWNV